MSARLSVESSHTEKQTNTVYFGVSQAKRQQRKLNFLITQTELYAHFMGGKASMAGPGGDAAQEEILKKLEDNSAQRQIDVGGGIMVNMGQEDYGMNVVPNSTAH